VIVLQIHVAGIFIIEPESDTPIAGYAYCVITPAITLERVESEPRQVHVFRLRGRVQPVKNPFKPGSKLRWDAPAITLVEKPLQSTVLERPDHNRP
jgi:hypothetical protein